MQVLKALFAKCPQLAEMRDAAGLTPMMVSASQAILTMDAKYNACWPILKGTMLNPEWDRR